MGYYDDCLPEQRFSSKEPRPRSSYGPGGSAWVIHDWDQRRVITVETSWREEDEDFIFLALAQHIDRLPRDANVVGIGQAGELISYSTSWREDETLIPFYPSDTSFPPNIPRIRR